MDKLERINFGKASFTTAKHAVFKMETSYNSLTTPPSSSP